MTVDEVIAAVRAPGYALADATVHAPRRPGIYGFHSDDDGWAALGLDRTWSDLPLYVGRALDSIAGRDVHEHFRGPSGKSTLRRSLAALLRDDLDLHARPRNVARPSHFTAYALDGDGEQKLSGWMERHLRLAWWESTSSAEVAALEVSVINSVVPPLNLTHVPARLPRLVAARAVMAAEAAAWRPRD